MSSPDQSQSLRILLVETGRLDDRVLLDALPLGAKIVHVGSVSEGVDSLNANDFDIIIVDIAIGNRVGTTLLRSTSKARGGAPVIAYCYGDDNIATRDCILDGVTKAMSRDYTVNREEVRAVARKITNRVASSSTARLRIKEIVNNKMVSLIARHATDAKQHRVGDGA